MVDREKRWAVVSKAEHHVHGHPRSGNHYLMAVVNENFIHAKGKFRDAFGHASLFNRHLHGLPGDCAQEWFDTGHHLYIWRDFLSVAKSILAMPERFGIVDKMSVEEFSHASWKDIYKEGGTDWVWRQVHDLSTGKSRKERGRGTAWGAVFHQMDLDLTTLECWNRHVALWTDFCESRDNFHVVKYEELLGDFQNTMLDIAQWLGSDRTEFAQVTQKVSGQPV